MIFLKKFLYTAFLLAVSCVFCFGCAKKESKTDSESTIQATSQPFTEREVTDTTGIFVFDKAGILSADDLKACNNYAGWLYNEKLINAAVITVSNLDGKTPYDYAAEEFGKIYEGKGSGLVILINNETDEDVIYKTGACFSVIDQKTQDNALFWATKDFVSKDYRKGIMRLLQLGEVCPSHIIDNAQVFEYDRVAALEKALASCKSDVTLLATLNGSSVKNEDILKDYYKRRYSLGNGIMLMIDTKSGSMIAYSDEKLSSGLEAALKDAGALTAKKDYFGAVNKIIEVLDGKKAS